MVWGLPRCVWARESTAPAQGNQVLSRELRPMRMEPNPAPHRQVSPRPCRAPGGFPAILATPGSTTGTDPPPTASGISTCAAQVYPTLAALPAPKSIRSEPLRCGTALCMRPQTLYGGELCVCRHRRAWAAGAEEGGDAWTPLTSKARPELSLSHSRPH